MDASQLAEMGSNWSMVLVLLGATAKIISQAGRLLERHDRHLDLQEAHYTRMEKSTARVEAHLARLAGVPPAAPERVDLRPTPIETLRTRSDSEASGG